MSYPKASKLNLVLLVLKSCWFLESSTVSLALLLWISQAIARIFAQWNWSFFCLTQNYFFGCIFLGKIGNSHRKPDAFVIQSLSPVWLCDIMDWTTPGFPVLHHFSELAQTHRVSDAIQPSHPLLSPSPPTFNLSASGSFPRGRFFASGGQGIGASASASVLPMSIDFLKPVAASSLHDYLVNMSALDSLLLMYEYTKSHFEMPCLLFDALHMENA